MHRPVHIYHVAHQSSRRVLPVCVPACVHQQDVSRRRMAFNNPSSRTPVSYGSATKSLGYIVGSLGRAFSGDDDEGAQLLAKKKAKGESRFMLGACCCCMLVLVCTVGGFIWALKSMTYPGELSKGDLVLRNANECRPWCRAVFYSLSAARDHCCGC